VNPATLVDAPKAAQHEITPLTAAEARRLIQAAEADRMQARWLVGLALGLRQGEALGLRWEDVDLDARLLRVRRALQRRRGGGLILTEPKTQRSKRTIPLSGQLAAALEDHRVRQAKERATTTIGRGRGPADDGGCCLALSRAMPRSWPGVALTWEFTGEVLTFRADLGKRGLAEGLPTG
jgi:integrase